MAEDKLLRIYLNDHLTTASAAAALARRTLRSNGDGDLERLLETIAADLADDLRSLEATMRERGFEPSRLKRGMGQLGERVGRLKLNGRLVSPSPLTPLVELEGLGLLLAHNASLWRSLETIGIERAAELAQRAEGHAESLRAARREVASAALGRKGVE